MRLSDEKLQYYFDLHRSVGQTILAAQPPATEVYLQKITIQDMANFHDKIVLNKYVLSLFGIDVVPKRATSPRRLNRELVALQNLLKINPIHQIREKTKLRHIADLAWLAFVVKLHDSPFVVGDVVQIQEKLVGSPAFVPFIGG